MITIVFGSVLVRPHRQPPPGIRTASLESQPILLIQQVLGRTLSLAEVFVGKSDAMFATTRSFHWTRWFILSRKAYLI
jgi:hypothetical protein